MQATGNQEARPHLGADLAHRIFLLLGIVFLVSAMGESGEGLTLAMGGGLLVMGVFAPARRRVLVGLRADRVIYVAAAVVVIGAGLVEVVSSAVAAFDILRGG